MAAGSTRSKERGAVMGASHIARIQKRIERDSTGQRPESENQVPKFQTRRVIIEAQQWWPPGHPSHDPSMLTHPGPDTHIKLGDLYLAVRGGQMGIGGEDWYSIQTPSGTARVKPGDWIITGPRTDIIDKYPCDPITFAAKYEPLEVNDQPDIG